MIYKAVPGPKVISISDGDHYGATETFVKIINRQAQDGWIYHSMETLTVQEKQGCDLQPQFVNTNLYMLIFYKEEAEVEKPKFTGGNNPAFGTTPTSVPVSAPSHAAPARPAAPAVAEGTWTCSKCGTKNSINYGQCKKCGGFRG